MKDCESATTDENVLNVTFSETDTAGKDVEGGAKKDNSLLLKYFTEDFRKNLLNKKAGDSITLQLKQAFEEKEREWVMDDLGLDKTNPADAEKNFRLAITKVGLLEKRELNEEFFNQLHPGGEVKTEADFRKKVKDEIQAYWDSQSKNQLQHQTYHELLDHTKIEFPQSFLKKWVKTQGEKTKTDEEVEHEFPSFLNQLKWTLITDKIVTESGIQVQPDEIKNFAKQQLLGYMGGTVTDDEQPWIKDYVGRMMKDRKFVEDTYNRLQTQKIFEWAESQVTAIEQPVSVEDFSKMVEEHQHQHH
jgi:trigger factor